jgi:hypothetical protein
MFCYPFFAMGARHALQHSVKTNKKSSQALYSSF